MQRIDNSGAVASLPAPLAAGTPGYFGRGNPSTGLLATPLSADWANMVQEEIMGVLAEAEITPDKEIYTQLRDALRVLYRGQRSGSQVLITGNTALTAEAHGGGLVIGNSGSALAATMMAASTLLSGRRVAFFNVNTGAMTVQRTGTDTFKVNSATVTSLVLGSGDSLVLESDGAGVWYAVGGSVQLRYAAAVATANTPEALVRRDASGNFSAGTITATLDGNASTATTAASTTGNAGTATALQTGRTISLTGDATGTSGAFNGTANASIAVTVVDNSHSHDKTTITSAVTADKLSASGSGSAPHYACRAWANWNGRTNAIRAAGNVSSITDLGVCDYRSNYSTAMADTNYVALPASDARQGDNGQYITMLSIWSSDPNNGSSTVDKQTTSIRLRVHNSAVEPLEANIAIFS